MIKIKPIIFCAGGAFVLSFFTALIARTGVPISLLKAFIFAIVFGGIAVGIQIVYNKFLSEGEASANYTAQKEKSVGSRVDLVVSEEDLPSDGETPTFSLDSTRHVLSGNDMKKVETPVQPKPVSEEQKNAVAEAAENVRAEKAEENIVTAAAPKNESVSASVGFKPVDLANNTPESEPEKKGGAFPDLPELDELPDFGVTSGEESSGGEYEDVIEDSEFAEEGSSQPSHQTEFPDGKLADAKDASIMAQAIQTVLAHEK